MHTVALDWEVAIVTVGSSRDRSFADRLFAPLGPRYDLLGEILSVGQNARWRAAMVDQIVPLHPRSVLDVATGTAGVAIQISERTSSSVIGLDISAEMMTEGRRRVRDKGLESFISFALGQGERLPFDDQTFDALSFTYLLRYVQDPAATIAELARVVKPGGRMVNLEFFVPGNVLLRAGWEIWMHTVLPAGGLIGGRGWFEVGRFLRPSIVNHYARYPLEWHLQAWREAGLTDVGHRVMSLGSGLVMWGTKA